MEPQYRQKTKRIPVFAQSAGVSQRGCSRPLQRVVTDFGADVPFAKVMDKLVEHYGIVICESTIRNVTQAHAQKIFERSAGQPLFIDPAQINMNFPGNFLSKIHGKRKRTKTNTGATARAAQASSEVA